jgi:hypothetical protein
MPIDTDVEELMGQYSFVPKQERDSVYETLYSTIQCFDTLSIIMFEFQPINRLVAQPIIPAKKFLYFAKNGTF